MNESRSYLAQEIGQVLDLLQSLNDDASSLGARQTVNAAKEIVEKIRQIIKGSWSDSDTNTLKKLQKIGVAIMNAIESNADLKDTIGSAVQELQSTSAEMKTPVNDFGSDENPIKSDQGN